MASYRDSDHSIDHPCKHTHSGLAECDIEDFQPGEDIAPLVHSMLQALGEDPTREGLRKTPARVNAAMHFLTRGYHESLTDIVGDALFESDADDVVLVRDIEVYSMCEHHLLPFWGRAHIAYVPAGKVIGLSKLPRIVDMFSRRLQLQERLTSQIADAVVKALKPAGVAVALECRHMCMMIRGVEKGSAVTATRALRGTFKTNESLRRDFMEMTTGNNRQV